MFAEVIDQGVLKSVVKRTLMSFGGTLTCLALLSYYHLRRLLLHKPGASDW